MMLVKLGGWIVVAPFIVFTEAMMVLTLHLSGE